MNELFYRSAKDNEHISFYRDYDDQQILAILEAYQQTGKTPEQVAEWAKAEQDGRLFWFPVYVGQVVYVHSYRTKSTGEVRGYAVESIGVNKKGEIWFSILDHYRFQFSIKDIGKTVFLTHEAAEAALKEREQS